MEKLIRQVLHELGEFRAEVNQRFEEVNQRFGEHNQRFEEHDRRLERLEAAVFGMREEHGTMLRAILEGKDVQRGEIDVIQIRAAKVEGAIKRAAKQVVKDLKEAK